jgi:hypothetical protein
LQDVPKETRDSLEVYVDASWMGKGAQSHHGFMATLWGIPIAWSARRQVAPARLTCQAEYIALSAASVKAIWLSEMLGGLLGPIKPIMYCNNRAAVKIATNKASVVKAKNINREFHYTNELIQKGRMDLEWIAGVDQMADVFTKALGPCLMGKFTGAVFG